MVDIAVLAGMGLASGLFLLWWGGDRTVTYAAQAAYLFGISGFFVGFVLVAISTGIPELSIAISSLITGATGLSVGDILGSNLTDVSLVLGAPATFVGSIFVPRAEKWHLLSLIALTGGVMLFVGLSGELTRGHGIFLLLVYAVTMFFMWRTRHAEEVIEDQEAIVRREIRDGARNATKLGVIIKLLASLVVVILGSQLSVQSALHLAHHFGLSLEVVGATILAFGSSLPELALSISAVRSGEYSLAIGNSFGSVLEQGGLILGLLAILSPAPLPIAPIRHVIPFMMLSYLIVAYGVWRREKINRIEGTLLLCLYASFITFEIMKLIG